MINFSLINIFKIKFKIDNLSEEITLKSSTISLLINDEDSQDSINENQNDCSLLLKTHVMECDQNSNLNELTIDDIRLFVHLFYLPYQHGLIGQQMFIDFHWLRFNYNLHHNVNFLKRFQIFEIFYFIFN